MPAISAVAPAAAGSRPPSGSLEPRNHHSAYLAAFRARELQMQHDDIVIQDREELFYLFSEAAEFEHSVMCSYLYALWSLKRDISEDVTADELQAIDGWRRSLRQVALEEMLHLSLVNNLLAATGASPHLWRPQFPDRKSVV